MFLFSIICQILLQMEDRDSGYLKKSAEAGTSDLPAPPPTRGSGQRKILMEHEYQPAYSGSIYGDRSQIARSPLQNVSSGGNSPPPLSASSRIDQRLFYFSVQLRCISKYRKEAVHVINTRPASDSIPVKYLRSPIGSISPKPRVVNVVNEK
jgi:hypothetical protein